LDPFQLTPVITPIALAGAVYLCLPDGRRNPWLLGAVLALALSPTAMILLGRLAMHRPFPSPPSPLSGAAGLSILMLVLVDIAAMALLGEFAVRGIERWRWLRLAVLAILGLAILALELFGAMVGAAEMSGVWF
jgi:hypothetical protein